MPGGKMPWGCWFEFLNRRGAEGAEFFYYIYVIASVAKQSTIGSFG